MKISKLSSCRNLTIYFIIYDYFSILIINIYTLFMERLPSINLVLFDLLPSSCLRFASLELSSIYLHRVVFDLPPSSCLRFASFELSSICLLRVVFDLPPSSCLRFASFELTSSCPFRVAFDLPPSNCLRFITVNDRICNAVVLCSDGTGFASRLPNSWGTALQRVENNGQSMESTVTGCGRLQLGATQYATPVACLQVVDN